MVAAIFLRRTSNDNSQTVDLFRKMSNPTELYVDFVDVLCVMNFS